jgi:hypothetical protein
MGFLSRERMIAVTIEVVSEEINHQAFGWDVWSLTINLPSMCWWMSPQNTLHIKIKVPALSALKVTKTVLPGFMPFAT